MRPPALLLLPVLLALTLAPAVQAQALQPAAPDPTSIAVVEVRPVDGPCRLRNEQARQIAGMYEMSNGWSVDVRPDMGHADVLVNGNRPLRLLALSPRKFVSDDGNVTMEFSRGNDDNDMTLRYVPAPGLAEVAVKSASFAQR